MVDNTQALSFTPENCHQDLLEAIQTMKHEIACTMAIEEMVNTGTGSYQTMENVSNIVDKILESSAVMEAFIPETVNVDDRYFITESNEELELEDDETMEPEFDPSAEEPMIEEPVEDEEFDGVDAESLEGIIIPTADGQEMVLQNGVLVPYVSEAPEAAEEMETEEEMSDTDLDEEAAMEEAPEEVEEEMEESEAVATTEETEAIEESATFNEFASNSDIVSKLINEINLR